MGSDRDTVWLIRRSGPCWDFHPDAVTGELTHRTRYGTEYLLLASHKQGKPFWVGRVFPESRAVVTVERAIGAREIEFPEGGRYVFPE